MDYHGHSLVCCFSNFGYVVKTAGEETEAAARSFSMMICFYTIYNRMLRRYRASTFMDSPSTQRQFWENGTGISVDREERGQIILIWRKISESLIYLPHPRQGYAVTCAINIAQWKPSGLSTLDWMCHVLCHRW